MYIKNLLLNLLILLPIVTSAAESGFKVMASIKPVHSLMSTVMQGVGEPTLLLKGGTSPHDYSLRPSDIRLLGEAKAVFWIGKYLEAFLAKPLENTKALSVALMQTPGVELLARRKGGIWEPHAHPNSDRGNDYDHAEKGHDHDQAGQKQSDYDAHIWLSPDNAIAMVRYIGTVLSEVDPEHKATYQANADALIKQLEALDAQLNLALMPIKDKPYIVFHDAYQYFERRYGLAAVGSITVSPEQRPGTRRLQEIRKRITDKQATCVFSEPQFKPALVNVLIEGTLAKSGVLDPLGTDLAEGPDAYFKLLTNLANSLNDCLVQSP